MAEGLAYRRISQDVENLISSTTLTTNNIKSIQWSEESVPLSTFVEKYPLPQIVMVEEGYDGGQDENSLGAGQVLKIHTATTERKALCIDRHNKEIYVPLHTTAKIKLRPEAYDTVYQKVVDLSKAKPPPPFVEVTRGYYAVDSNVTYELSVEPGEILEVIQEHSSNSLTRLQRAKNKCMSFLNKEGVEIKLPFDCVAGFKPLIDNKTHVLSDVLIKDGNNNSLPFYFEFLESDENPPAKHHRLGVLKCTSIYDDKLIIASCGQGAVQTVFMIPQDLEITVKIALGTIKNDPNYEDIKSSFHDFKSLENDVKKSRMSQIFRTSQEISGFTYTRNNKEEWVTFDENAAQLNGGEKYIETAHATQENGLESGAITGKNGVVEINANSKAESIPEIQETSQNEPEKFVEPSPFEIINVMTVEELCEEFRKVKMRETIINEFESNNIDGELFLQLDDDELSDLGARKFDLKKLSMFKKGWRPKKSIDFGLSVDLPVDEENHKESES